MMRMLLVLAMLCASTACATAQTVPSVTLPAQLDRVLRDYERGWKTAQADSVAGLFAIDGFALPSNRPPARGRSAIAAVYAGSGGDLRLRALDWAVADSIGFIIGAYHYGESSSDVGKFVLALRRDRDGRWLIAADIDNANSRPRTATSPPEP